MAKEGRSLKLADTLLAEFSDVLLDKKARAGAADINEFLKRYPPTTARKARPLLETMMRLYNELRTPKRAPRR